MSNGFASAPEMKRYRSASTTIEVDAKCLRNSPYLSGPDELWRELRAWIERENGRLHFGFLHLRQPEKKRTHELSFGEMLFHHGLDPLWVKRATRYIGSRADMYEAYLTGIDNE
jgi:hypothetical protein